MEKKAIKKAVITAAGYGTRFLPATKNIQKEMLPIMSAPIIHYVVKEVIEAGVTDIIIVARQGKTQITEYFKENPVLVKHLQAQGKLKYIKPFEDLYKKADINVIYQDENMPYGNGTPLLSAKKYIRDENHFLYVFADDMVRSDTSCCLQLVNCFNTEDCDGIIAVQDIPRELTKSYGIVKLKDASGKKQIEKIVEKPRPDQTPSTLAAFGRYVLPGEVFKYLSPEYTGKDNELWLVDAVENLLVNMTILAHEIEGKWLTTGDPLNLLQANIDFFLHNADTRERALDILKAVLNDIS